MAAHLPDLEIVTSLHADDMARRTGKRSELRRTANGAWTCSLGDRGARVRLFQKRRDGVFYRAVWRPVGGEDQRALGTQRQGCGDATRPSPSRRAAAR